MATVLVTRRYRTERHLDPAVDPPPYLHGSSKPLTDCTLHVVGVRATMSLEGLTRGFDLSSKHSVAKMIAINAGVPPESVSLLNTRTVGGYSGYIVGDCRRKGCRRRLSAGDADAHVVAARRLAAASGAEAATATAIAFDVSINTNDHTVGQVRLGLGHMHNSTDPNMLRRLSSDLALPTDVVGFDCEPGAQSGHNDLNPVGGHDSSSGAVDSLEACQQLCTANTQCASFDFAVNGMLTTSSVATAACHLSSTAVDGANGGALEPHDNDGEEGAGWATAATWQHCEKHTGSGLVLGMTKVTSADLTADELADDETTGRRCAAGHFLFVGVAGGNSVCSPCEPGQFSDGSDQLCFPCPAGHFAATAGSGVCSLCEPGTFQDVAGSTSCVSCSGATTDSAKAACTNACNTDAHCSNPARAWCDISATPRACVPKLDGVDPAACSTYEFELARCKEIRNRWGWTCDSPRLPHAAPCQAGEVPSAEDPRKCKSACP